MSGRMLMLPVAGEQGASTRYRVLALRPGLESAGWSSTVRFPPAPRSGPLGRWRRLRDLLRDTRTTPDADLLFIHRKTYPPFFAQRLRRLAAPIVYDLDDAIDLPPPGRTASDRLRARYRRNFESTVAAADLVLCGNRELVRRSGHARCEIVPTPIDVARFRPGAIRAAEGPTIGWVGHRDNLPYLESLVEPLRELARRHSGLKLVVVADRPPALPGIEVEFRRWNLDEELRCFDGIAIGLMPLPDDPWARAKCSFKAIQYMALGLPAVVSPVGMNADLVRDGDNGCLAGSAEQWVQVLDSLLRDRELARRIGAAGRRTIERDYAVDVVAGRVAALLDRIARDAR